MSDVLIKGCDIAKPENCLKCRFLYMWQEWGETVLVECKLTHRQQRFKKGEKIKIAGGCPLVEIPNNVKLCDLNYLYEHEKFNVEQASFDAYEVLEDIRNALSFLGEEL